MAAIAGWNGSLSVGGTTLPVTRWNISWKTDALEVTTMETTGPGTLMTPLSAFTPGITDMDISFDAIWDTTVDPIVSSPPNLRPGTRITSMTVSLAGGTSWTFTNVLLTDLNMDDEVRGIVKYTCSGKVSGSPVGTGITLTLP